ncbi:GTP 3',8-cyclase MoaA [Clostridium sp. Mt-5]|uniref:GTP 3',8-cyclase n=1 Tax=Clostridium moutaii TaxID=3240932 RepID=A0ABV4BS17_9CLOT
MEDKYGRKINYLRVSLIDRCNLRCRYCMPKEGIIKRPYNELLRFEDILKIIKAAAHLGINKIRYTGGEPLIVKDIDYLIEETAKIQGVSDLAITTNGTLLYDLADKLKSVGLKRVNISLDTLKRDKFNYITRGGNIDTVLKSIEKCLSIGLTPVKINVVLIKGFNDEEVVDFIRITKDLPIEIRFIELMPIGQGEKLYKTSYLSSENVLKIIKNTFELVPQKTHSGSTVSLYKVDNYRGNIGFISPMSCKFCKNCNRIRLTSVGNLKPCLHSDKVINLKSCLNNAELLTENLKQGILSKPLQHNMDSKNKSESNKMMYQIGG